MRLSPMVSMKPHQFEVQLLWVLDLVVVEVHVEVHQLLQPRQETCLFPCSDMAIVLGLVHKMKLNHVQNLSLQWNHEPVVVAGSEWQEPMKFEVEHSLTCPFHLLVYLLCLHHPCRSCLSFLCLCSGN